jgi:hypothetical protein
VFGNAVDCGSVRIRRRRWHPLQPRNITMAPCGHIHFHPDSPAYREDFAQADLASQGFFIHEMTHVWQTQTRGPLYLPLLRHPFCRYGYQLRPGWPLTRYGLEQQAEIIRHAFLLRHGVTLPGSPTPQSTPSSWIFQLRGERATCPLT